MEQQQQPLYRVLEKKDIPAKATAEINRLYQVCSARMQALVEAQEAFNEYVRVVRKAVGMPAENGPNANWDMSEDATAFVRLPDDAQPIVIEQGPAPEEQPAQSAVECICDESIDPSYPHDPHCPKGA